MTASASTASVSFTVYGMAVPQGSKRVFRGNVVDMASQRLRSFRQEVHITALEAMKREPFTGPVHVQVSFFIPRPKHHYGTGRNSEKRKTDAPIAPAKAPDIDKLARAVLDALTGACFADDAQVVGLVLAKLWADHSDTATVISVTPLS